MNGIYVPVVRHKRTFERVFQQLGGLSSFSSESHKNKLVPLLEITSDQDIEELHPYRGAADDLLVELPVYHYTTEEDNDLAAPIQSLSKEFGGQVGFYRSNLADIDIPVISDSIRQPFDYDKIVDKYRRLSGDTNSIAARLFISSRKITEEQRASLEDLAGVMADNEYVLLDIIEVGVKGAVRENLETIASILRNQNVIVLNVFNPSSDQATNKGPELCSDLDLEGFGDFALGRRYEVSFPYTGPRKIRYYDPSSSEIVLSEGDDYPEAANKLASDGLFDPDHCGFCSEGSHYNKDGVGKWSSIEKGHFVVSSLNEELD